MAQNINKDIKNEIIVFDPSFSEDEGGGIGNSVEAFKPQKVSFSVSIKISN